MALQSCSVCSADVSANPRHPRYVCTACVAKASSADGRMLEFFNTDASGGLAARYADTKEPYLRNECFIDGVSCSAFEARLGGVVIERVG